MQEAVVLEAAPAEQRVERVQALLALHRAGVRPVDVGRALGRQRAGQLLLRQLLVPDGGETDACSHELDEANA